MVAFEFYPRLILILLMYCDMKAKGDCNSDRINFDRIFQHQA